MPDMGASPKHDNIAVIIYFFLIAGIEMIVQFFLHLFHYSFTYLHVSYVYSSYVCFPFITVDSEAWPSSGVCY